MPNSISRKVGGSAQRVADRDLELVHSYHGRRWSDFLVGPGNFVLPLLEHAKRHASDPFITETVAPNVTITYGKAMEEVAALACLLRTRYGARPLDRIAVIPKNNIDSILAIFAVAAVGATVVLINRTIPAVRMVEQIRSVMSTLVITSEIPLAANDMVVVEAAEIRASSAQFGKHLDWPSQPEEPAIILFTTGTTASSKAVIQTHYNVVLNSTVLACHHRLRAGVRLLGVLPVYYANGLEFSIVATMIGGGHVVLMPEFDPLIYLRNIERHKINIASVVPAMLDAIVPAKPRAFDRLNTLGYFASAAAPLRRETVRRVYERLGKRVVQGYGLTETTNFSTIMPVNLSDVEYRRWMLDADIPSVGLAVEGNEVAILAKDLSLLSPGETGEICMRGHNVMARYEGNPEATALSFKGGWFHTGDLGMLVCDTTNNREYLLITGRIKNIIKSAGKALSLDEMDRLLIESPGVAEVVTLSLPDSTWGEVPGVLVVMEKGCALSEAALRKALDVHLSTSGIPMAMKQIDRIPRTGNGKIARNSLAHQFFPERMREFLGR